MNVWNPSNFTVLLIFLLLCFVPTNIYFVDGIDSISLLIITPLLLLLAIIKLSCYLKNNEIKLYFIWFLWVAFTCVTAIRPNLAFQNLKTIAGGVMMSLIYYLFSHKEKLLPYLYAVFIVILMAELYYVSAAFDVIDLGVDIRANDEKLNANTIAYMCFYSICSVYYIGDLVKNKSIARLLKMSFFAMIPVVIYVSFITASRQVLPTSLAVWVFLFYQRYLKGSRKSINTLFIIIVVSIAAVVLYDKVFQSLYSGSMLALRTEETDATDTRFLIIKEALRVSSDYLIFGVGSGNFVHMNQYHIFTHNSYLEMLVSSGILGLILYVAVIYKFLKNQMLRYRATRDSAFITFFAVGVLWSIYNFLYVFYVGVYLMPFLFLMMGHSDYLYRKYLSMSYI